MHTAKTHRNLGTKRKLTLLTLAALPAFSIAQPTAPATQDPKKEEEAQESVVQMEAVSVTGSNIKRVDQEKVLPVTIFSAAQIQARDSVTPMDLLTGLPEVTNIPQNETSTNAVAGRGGNANVALRGLGSESTLVLLNGHRLPNFPFNTSSVNVNNLPTSGISQVELLRDGASAIYGSDAVAGVVNYVTEKKPKGGQASVRYGVTEHGGGMDIKGDLSYGKSFADGKGTYLFSVSAYYRDKIFANERDFSKTTDRSYLQRAPFANSNYNGQTPTAANIYAQFALGTVPSNVNIANLTLYKVLPLDGKKGDAAGITTAAIPQSLYFNTNDYVIGQPMTGRYNFYNRWEYDVSKSLRAYAEVTGYLANSLTGRAPISIDYNDSQIPIVLSPDNPYNPFGSKYYGASATAADGTARVVGTPQAVSIYRVLATDGGPEKIRSNESMYRLMTGVGGDIGTSSWSWEANASLGGVFADDLGTNNIRDSQLALAAARTDSTAWNPFGYTFKVSNGAVVVDQAYSNPKSVRETYTESANRTGHTKLATGDLKFGGNVATLWAGPIVASFGTEWRYEYREDHKDPWARYNVPSTVTVLGVPYNLAITNNDILVMSPKYDFHASRSIASGFAETIVPLASPKNGIPMVQTLEGNASVRYERYSDFGSTTKPKFGLNWRPFNGLMIRASINKGFRAPDLATVYQPTAFGVATPPGTRDTTRQAYLNGAIGVNDEQILSKSYTVPNPTLKPEQSTGKSVGFVFDIPKVKGLSISIDYWEIQQKDYIVTTDALDDISTIRAYTQKQLNAAVSAGQDPLVAIQNIDVGFHTAPDQPNTYKGSPNLLRAAVNDTDRALFARTYAVLPRDQWIAPLGSFIGSVSSSVNAKGSTFTNGIDYTISYNLPRTQIGQFRAGIEVSQFLNKYTKLQQQFAKNDDLIQMIVARVKGSANLSWRKGPWDASVNVTYNSPVRTGAFLDATTPAAVASFVAAGSPGYAKLVNVVSSIGTITPRYYERGESQTQVNTGFSYRFGPQATPLLRRTSVRLGINNILDEDPSNQNLASTGYGGGTGSSLWIGRSYSLSLTRDF